MGSEKHARAGMRWLLVLVPGAAGYCSAPDCYGCTASAARYGSLCVWDPEVGVCLSERKSESINLGLV